MLCQTWQKLDVQSYNHFNCFLFGSSKVTERPCKEKKNSMDYLLPKSISYYSLQEKSLFKLESENDSYCRSVITLKKTV